MDSLGVRFPERKGHHVGKNAISENFSYIRGEVDRRGVMHEIGDDALSEPQGLGMGRVIGVELWELVDEPAISGGLIAFWAEERISGAV